MRVKLNRQLWLPCNEDAIGYLVTAALTGLALVGFYLTSLVVLHGIDFLPPPSFVNDLCADMKLESWRNQPPVDATLLVVGSSVALSDVDGEQIVHKDPSARPINGSMCAAQVNQAAFVAQYIAERFPSVRTVVAALEPHDFRACSKTPDRLFSPQDVDDYIFRRRWVYGFYLQYFDLHSLERRVRHLHSQRGFDQWGDFPLYGRANDLVYGAFEGYDPSCFGQLRHFAEWLGANGRKLIVVTTPLNPTWSAQYDRDGSVSQTLSSGIRSALVGTDAQFWDGNREFPTVPEDFGDAVHLRWPSALRYSEAMVEATGLARSGVAHVMTKCSAPLIGGRRDSSAAFLARTSVKCRE